MNFIYWFQVFRKYKFSVPFKYFDKAKQITQTMFDQ